METLASESGAVNLNPDKASASAGFLRRAGQGSSSGRNHGRWTEGTRREPKSPTAHGRLEAGISVPQVPVQKPGSA